MGATWAQEKETSDMCGGKERKEKQFQNVLDMPGLGMQCSKGCKNRRQFGNGQVGGTGGWRAVLRTC